MKKLLFIVSVLFGVLFIQGPQNRAVAAPGAAGFPQVIEGDKLRFGNMIVELFGIRAPRTGMICRAGSIEFQCGDAATQALRRIIENYAVKCQQVSETQLFPMLTECTMGRSDLNRLLLRAGWALVDMASCDSNPTCATYLRDQAFAKENRKGMWMGTPPHELVALAAKPKSRDTNVASDDNNSDDENYVTGPIAINLAAEMEKANEPDRTLLSFLDPTS
ncbi:thermonuclease family protein [Thalassospira lucentensis]|uniref:thermonuclease family protein n=1 Tax=Thalassospira lucentensis TaxID=168935 RepID=UPI00142D93A6|nr:thermonuclease family protein [Thalassospira lucentensis]NIZ02635.1 thermonuclease family protein [Thalassospira lucentensis]